MKRGERECGRSGFTLLEIMVAMALLLLVVAAIYSTWLAVVRGSKSGREAAATVQRSRVAVRTLEDALTCAQSFNAVQYYSFIAENGSEPSLSFVARLPRSFLRGGDFGDYTVRRVEFKVEPGPDGSLELVLRQNPLLMDRRVEEEEYPLVLAKNVKAFEMEFWDLRSGDWIDEWTQTNTLPAMVRFTLRLGGNDRYSSEVRDEITREISIPAVSVTAPPPGSPPRRQ